MSVALGCWKCGKELGEIMLPMARLAECPKCATELHVCRMCRFYDTGKSGACSEPVADEVQDKDRANFCGYFEPISDAFMRNKTESDVLARAELGALFGGSTQPLVSDGDADRQALDSLFSKPDQK